MSKLCRFIALALLLFIIIPGCSTPPLRIQSDVVPAGSLRVAQVVIIANREQILSNPEMYKHRSGNPIRLHGR